MRLTSGWLPALRAREARKALLVTVVLGLDVRPDEWDHVATLPGALRWSTHRDIAVTHSGRTYPFWPYLAAWPEIRFRCAPERREYEVTTVDLDVTGAASFPATLRELGDHAVGWGRIDLWTDGLDLDAVIPLVAGPVEVVDMPRRAATMRLRITDGEIDRAVPFPPGVISRAEFGAKVPLASVDRVRTVVLGPFPYQPIACIPLDETGHRFYVAEPPLAQLPTAWFKGDERLERHALPRVYTSRTVSGVAYTEAYFQQSVNAVNTVGEVGALGGVGLVLSGSALVDLLTRYGGYSLTGRATAQLAGLSERYSSLAVWAAADTQSTVAALVRDRFAPQTDLLTGWRLGRVDTLQLDAPSHEVALTVGSQLVYRASERDITTRIDNVYNSFEVRWGRVTNGVGESGVVLYDSSTADGTVAGFLAASARRYGSRHLSWDAADLGSAADARQLARTLARTTAYIHQRHTYAATWEAGVQLDLLDRVYLTDATEQLTAVASQVVEWALPDQAGPVLTLQTIDDERREGTRA